MADEMKHNRSGFYEFIKQRQSLKLIPLQLDNLNDLPSDHIERHLKRVIREFSTWKLNNWINFQFVALKIDEFRSDRDKNIFNNRSWFIAMFINPDEIWGSKETVSNSNKEKGFTYLRDKLPGSDLQQLLRNQ